MLIEIDTQPQERPRVYGRIAVDPPKSKAFKRLLAEKVKLLKGDSDIFTGALKVTLAIYRDKKSTTSQRFGDIDNLVKSIFDGLTGVVWKDDRQVVELHVTKNLSSTPHILLEVQQC